MLGVDDRLYIAWQTDPVLIGGIWALSVIYTLAVGPLRKRIAPDEPFPVRNAILFYLGNLLFFLTEGSPLHDLAERYSLFAHMLQHNLVTYAVAPLLLAGTPVWLIRAMFVKTPIYPVARFITRPLTAFILFTVGYSMWHLPLIYEAGLQNSVIHHTQHVVFLAAAIVLWWPIMSQVPELPRPARLTQLVYMFLQPVFQMLVYAVVTFAFDNLYPTYEMAPTWFTATQAEDQQLAGAFMGLSSFIAFGIPFIVTFARWYHEETGRTFEGHKLNRPEPEYKEAQL